MAAVDIGKTLVGHGATGFAISIDGTTYNIDDDIIIDAKNSKIVLKGSDSHDNDDIEIVSNGTEITVALNLVEVLDFANLATLLDWTYSSSALKPRGPVNGAPQEFVIKILASTNRKQETIITDEDLTYDPVPNSTLLSFTTTLANTPIKPGSVTITTGSEACTDAATPNVLAGTNVNGTIKYLTGAAALVFGAGKAPAVGDARHGTYTYYSPKRFTWIHNRAVLDNPSPSGALKFKRGEKTLIPLQFRFLADTTNYATYPWGKITLETV